MPAPLACFVLATLPFFEEAAAEKAPVVPRFPTLLEFPVNKLLVRAGGRAVVEAIKYGNRNERSSGLELDWLSLRFTAETSEAFRLVIEPDLLNVDSRGGLWQAFGALKLSPAVELRAGKMPVMTGSESATLPEDQAVYGYAFPSYLQGRYDWAVALQGQALDEALWWQTSYAFGEGFGLEGSRRESPQLTGRAVVHPLRHTEWEALQGFFAGLAVSYSHDYRQPLVLATPVESTVFTTPDLNGDEALFWHLDLGWAWRSLRLGFESVNGEVSDVPIGGGATQDMDQLTSFHWWASWFITGERPQWSQGGWQPVLPAGDVVQLGRLSAVGAWELAARYSNADMDRRLFSDGITAYDPSTQEVRTFTINLNWYLGSGVRAGLGWLRVIADDELTTLGGTNRDSSYVFRMDFTF